MGSRGVVVVSDSLVLSVFGLGMSTDPKDFLLFLKLQNGVVSRKKQMGEHS